MTQTETLFLTHVYQLASKYGAAVEVDLENHVLNFTGISPDKEIDLAMEIEKAWGEYSG